MLLVTIESTKLILKLWNHLFTRMQRTSSSTIAGSSWSLTCSTTTRSNAEFVQRPGWEKKLANGRSLFAWKFVTNWINKHVEYIVWYKTVSEIIQKSMYQWDILKRHIHRRVCVFSYAIRPLIWRQKGVLNLLFGQPLIGILHQKLPQAGQNFRN